METKTCSKCKTTKSLDEFYKKLYGRQNWCKTCTLTRQKMRWRDRKKRAVELLGGKCQICGYDKNLACMDFHHKDPSQKNHEWRSMRLYGWKRIVEELKKCMLLCRNCHGEIHWPYQSLVLTGNGDNESLQNVKALEPTGNCLHCGSPVYGTDYCSVKCVGIARRKVTRPTKKHLAKMLETMSWCAIGRKYDVSDSAIRKWARKYGILPKL